MAGAKRRLRALARDEVPQAPSVEAAQQVNQRADLLALRRELSELQKAIDAVLAPAPIRKQSEFTATVTAAVPSSVPLRGRLR
jgi:hypothetical protein